MVKALTSGARGRGFDSRPSLRECVVLLVPSSTPHGPHFAHGSSGWLVLQMGFVSWENYGASPIFLGACTNYTPSARGKNVQSVLIFILVLVTHVHTTNKVYYYLRKGQKTAQYGGKKGERGATFFCFSTD